MLLYDRDCRTGTRLAAWIAGRLRVPISVEPWQEIRDLDELGLTVAEVSTSMHWVDAYGRIDRGHRAIGRALTMTSGPTVLAGWILLVPPGSWLGAAASRFVPGVGRPRRHGPASARTA